MPINCQLIPETGVDNYPQNTNFWQRCRIYRFWQVKALQNTADIIYILIVHTKTVDLLNA